MAVQAQQHNPLSTASFANDFHTDESRQIATILDQYRNQEIQQQVQHKTMLNGTLQMVLSSDPDSDLTCNLSGSRKRPRDIHQVATNSTQFLLQQQQQRQQQMLLANRLQIGGAGFLPAVKPAMLPQKIAATTDDSRFIQSTMTSTSGRPLVSATAAPVPSTSMDLIAQQNGEIEALIQFQTKKLRYDLEEMRKRHWCTIVSAMEQQLQYLLKAKQAELDSVSKKNTELEEKVKQMAAENRIWFQMAKNSETLVMGLRSSLEQALMQNVAIPNNDNAIVEGFGDSEDDAQSCCYNTEVEKARRKAGADPDQSEQSARFGPQFFARFLRAPPPMRYGVILPFIIILPSLLRTGTYESGICQCQVVDGGPPSSYESTMGASFQIFVLGLILDRSALEGRWRSKDWYNSSNNKKKRNRGKQGGGHARCAWKGKLVFWCCPVGTFASAEAVNPKSMLAPCAAPPRMLASKSSCLEFI